MMKDQIADNQPGTWYAIYTRSRAEKSLHKLLTQKGIECFLPLKKTLKLYSDRKKWVEEPLLRCYLFVRIREKEYFEVLNCPGAVRYVCFEGRAVGIPDRQILALKNFMENKAESLEVFEGHLEAGELMEVSRGPLKGLRGEFLQVRGNNRLVLRFESLGVCVHSEVRLQDVKRVDKQQVA
jgi:transcriptional antiterminator RfaH